MAKADNPR
ncbi:unnamed protein product, partial [Rotaria magnacalcarata]